MDAQEREAGVRDRVDQALAQIPGVRGQRVVVAAERHDPLVAGSAGHPGHLVGLEAGTGDDVATDHVALHAVTAGDGDDDLVGAFPDLRDTRARPDLGAQRPDVVGIGQRDLAEVDDPGPWRMEGEDSGGVRLDLADLLGPDLAQARHVVGDRPLLQRREAGQLGFVERHDQLSAELVRDPLLRGVRLDRRLALACRDAP